MATYDTFEEAEQAADAESVRMDRDNVFIDFDGQNCEDADMECIGWDGNDRRCNCGNRRVSWNISQDYQGKFYFYAEAY